MGNYLKWQMIESYVNNKEDSSTHGGWVLSVSAMLSPMESVVVRRDSWILPSSVLAYFWEGNSETWTKSGNDQLWASIRYVPWNLNVKGLK